MASFCATATAVEGGRKEGGGAGKETTDRVQKQGTPDRRRRFSLGKKTGISYTAVCSDLSVEFRRYSYVDTPPSVAFRR